MLLYDENLELYVDEDDEDDDKETYNLCIKCDTLFETEDKNEKICPRCIEKKREYDRKYCETCDMCHCQITTEEYDSYDGVCGSCYNDFEEKEDSYY